MVWLVSVIASSVVAEIVPTRYTMLAPPRGPTVIAVRAAAGQAGLSMQNSAESTIHPPREADAGGMTMPLATPSWSLGRAPLVREGCTVIAEITGPETLSEMTSPETSPQLLTESLPWTQMM